MINKDPVPKFEDIAFLHHTYQFPCSFNCDVLYTCCVFLQVMKTYHMYHTESLSAESKLKEAEKQEEKHIGKANDIGLRYGYDDRPQRRSSVKKMEKLKEKVCF